MHDAGANNQPEQEHITFFDTLVEKRDPARFVMAAAAKIVTVLGRDGMKR